MAAPWEFPAPNPWDPTIPVPTPNPWEPPAPNPWDASCTGSGSLSPTDWSTLTTANIPPSATPTGLAEETPAKGTTGWLYATIGCIIVIIFLLIFNCVQWVGIRQLNKEAKSRRTAERR
ncbi:hypothetical protein CDV31_001198 [Fusarium ambrosium]|uniref:Uncharacterized protein n=1 Tax=Fusarium ambrosium TaxID=131363 RepID=A0A428V004_9HYPO|nr:hypothetical protein CDV31_001198 [Fusarium ambrosium]